MYVREENIAYCSILFLFTGPPVQIFVPDMVGALTMTIQYILPVVIFL